MFVFVELQSVEISCNVFSQQLCFKLHALNYKFLNQFHYSKHFAFFRNGFDASQPVVMFTQP